MSPYPQCTLSQFKLFFILSKAHVLTSSISAFAALYKACEVKNHTKEAGMAQ